MLSIFSQVRARSKKGVNHTCKSPIERYSWYNKCETPSREYVNTAKEAFGKYFLTLNDIKLRRHTEALKFFLYMKHNPLLFHARNVNISVMSP